MMKLFVTVLVLLMATEVFGSALNELSRDPVNVPEEEENIPSELQQIVEALQPLTGEEVDHVLRIHHVRGNSVRALVIDYAERILGYEVDEYELNMRLNASQIPVADDEWVIGLARIVDVTHLVADPMGELDGAELQAKTRIVRKALFQARRHGGLVGVASGTWAVCGMNFPGVFILDRLSRVVIELVPRDTSC